MTSRRLAFGPYCLDEADGSLWRAGEHLPLTPKCLALLRYLAARPGRLIPKDELLAAVWPDTHVADGVLKVRMRELRAALGDDAARPRFIETVHRRGYRFIATVRDGADAPAVRVVPSAPLLVGRDDALAELDRRFQHACAGRRQIVFVTGEAGIGKTAIVDAFASALPAAVWVGRGQGLAPDGGGAVFHPVQAALGQIARAADAAEVVAALRRCAPTWLITLPWLLDAADRERLQGELRGATRERMLRELAEAFEVVTAQRPLVLLLEDLHWSDPSTVDLVSVLAHRREPARLLLLVTFRAVDDLGGGPSLQAVAPRLAQQRLATEIRLPRLDRVQIDQLLRAHLDAVVLPAGLAERVLDHTAGNPLRAKSLADDLLARGWLTRAGDGGYVLSVEPAVVAVAFPRASRG